MQSFAKVGKSVVGFFFVISHFGLNLNLGVCAVYISDPLMEVTFYIQ